MGWMGGLHGLLVSWMACLLVDIFDAVLLHKY